MVIPEAPVSGTVEFLPSQVVKPHWTSNIFRFQVTRVTSGPEFLCPRVLGAFYHCDRKLKIKNKSKQKATKKKKTGGGEDFFCLLISEPFVNHPLALACGLCIARHSVEEQDGSPHGRQKTGLVEAWVRLTTSEASPPATCFLQDPTL